MPHRVLAAALLGSLLCAAPRQAFAGDPPLPGQGEACLAPTPPRAAADVAPAWPTKLKLRNARYATLTRVDDPSGDVHERLIAHMQMNRVDDHVGDLEEVRRRRTSERVPPLAVKDALVMRERDLLGDGNEVVLATMRHERRHAETRRFRDLAGDSHELADYKRDQKQIRLDREDRIIMTNESENTSRARYLYDRGFEEREAGETMGAPERLEDQLDDKDERDLIDDEDRFGFGGRGRGGDEGEPRDEVEDEPRDGPGSDDRGEELGEDSDARMEESLLERRTEAQLEQEEAGAGGKPK